MARTARCFGPPRESLRPSSVTSKGPSTAKCIGRFNQVLQPFARDLPGAVCILPTCEEELRADRCSSTTQLPYQTGGTHHVQLPYRPPGGETESAVSCRRRPVTPPRLRRCIASRSNSRISYDVDRVPQRLCLQPDRPCDRSCEQWRHSERRPWHVPRRVHDRQEPEPCWRGCSRDEDHRRGSSGHSREFRSHDRAHCLDPRRNDHRRRNGVEPGIGGLCGRGGGDRATVAASSSRRPRTSPRVQHSR